MIRDRVEVPSRVCDACGTPTLQTYSRGLLTVETFPPVVRYRGVRLHLNERETRLMLELVRHGAIRRERFLDLAVGPDSTPNVGAVVLSKLRRRLGEACDELDGIIVTEGHWGLRLVAPIAAEIPSPDQHLEN